jgi:hypothetical protein
MRRGAGLEFGKHLSPMNPRVSKVAGPAFAALAFCGACASTEHARSIASAGAAYGKAVDALIAATEEAAADADSARLLSEARGLSREQRRELLARHDTVSPTLADMERLRRHGRLLTRYFQALGRLASDDADTAAADATADAAAALNRLGTQLTGSTLVTPAERDLLSQTAALSVEGARRAAIERELKSRASLIDHEIALQGILLDALRRKIRADLESSAALGLERDVTRPFLDDTVADPRGWIALRRGYLLSPPDADAIKSASDAASKLRSAWRAFASGRLDETARSALMADIETMVSYAEAVRRVQP